MKIHAPRISLNKLGEYLIANPMRRRSIIKAQQEPSPAIVPLYQKAIPILERFLLSEDPDYLHQGIEKLRNTIPRTDWEANDYSNTALALEAFSRFADQLDLSGMEISKADPQETAKLNIAGVAVSVRPDFYLKIDKRNRLFIGALKFHWTKDDHHRLTTDGGIYVATTVHQFLEQQHADKRKASPQHCFSIDVFRGSISTAPTGYKLKRKHVEAACEEIALRWGSH